MRQWINRLPIKYKIFFISLAWAAGFCGYLLYNASVTRDTASILQTVEHRLYPALERADNSIKRLERIQQLLTDAVVTSELGYLEQADTLAKELRLTLESLKQEERYEDAVTEIANLFERYYKSAREVAHAMVSEIQDPDHQGKMEQANDTSALLQEHIKAFRDFCQAEVSASIEKAKALSRKGVIIGVSFGGLLLLVIGSSSYFVSLLITRRLQRVVTSLQEIASGEGDLTQRVVSSARDEVGELVAAFNQFIDKLQGTVKSVNAGAQPLVRISDQLAALAEKSQSKIAEQRNNIQLASTSLHQLTDAIDEISDNAEQAASSSGSVREQAGLVAKIVSQNHEASVLLANEVKQTVSLIEGLNKDTENVGVVLDVIRNITDQTNLLALNAAIEAARAGEHGRGFSIVASEVRTLANRTQQSTAQIKHIIEQLQTAARGVVRSMQQSVERTSVSVEHADQIQGYLSKIIAMIQAVSQMNTAIASSTVAQRHVSHALNQSVEEIDKGIADSAQVAKQVAAASQQTSSMGHEIERQMGRFKV